MRAAAAKAVLLALALFGGEAAAVAAPEAQQGVAQQKQIQPEARVEASDPQSYRPPHAAFDSAGRPVYPEARRVPRYPNALQLDRSGRPVYPALLEVGGGGFENPSYAMPGGPQRSVMVLPQTLGDDVQPYAAPPSVMARPEDTFTPPMGVAPSARNLPYELRNTPLFTRPGMSHPVGTFAFVEEQARAAARHTFTASACRNCAFYNE